MLFSVTIIIFVIIALIFIGGIAGAIYTISRSGTTASTDSATASTGSSASTSNAKPLNACDILTKSVAESLLGSNSDKVDVPAQQAPSIDLDSSSCTYRTKIDNSNETPQTNISALILTVYTPKNKNGEDAVAALFDGAAPGAQNISGFGEKAYYVPSYRQLNVLKNRHWYVIVYAKDTPINSTLETDKQFAEKLKFQ